LPKPIEIYGAIEVANLYCAVNILIGRLEERTPMNGEGANPYNCKAWCKTTMQAKSKLLNGYNV